MKEYPQPAGKWLRAGAHRSFVFCSRKARSSSAASIVPPKMKFHTDIRISSIFETHTSPATTTGQYHRGSRSRDVNRWRNGGTHQNYLPIFGNPHFILTFISAAKSCKTGFNKLVNAWSSVSSSSPRSGWFYQCGSCCPLPLLRPIAITRQRSLSTPLVAGYLLTTVGGTRKARSWAGCLRPLSVRPGDNVPRAT